MSIDVEQIARCSYVPAADWVYIPGGSFLMGSPEDETGRIASERQHGVNIKPFWIMDAPVTFDLYGDYCRGMRCPPPSDNGWGRNNRPAINLTWGAAVSTMWEMNMRHDHLGFKFRLPTEAEWEYACRAGTSTRYSFGDEINARLANFGHGPESPNQTVPVKSYPPNHWGLYDMHGNVAEWTGSVYTEEYDGTELIDFSDISKQVDDGPRVRAVRGGSWYSQKEGLRSARRVPMQDDEWSTVGFRMVCSEADKI